MNPFHPSHIWLHTQRLVHYWDNPAWRQPLYQCQTRVCGRTHFHHPDLQFTSAVGGRPWVGQLHMQLAYHAVLRKRSYSSTGRQWWVPGKGPEVTSKRQSGHPIIPRGETNSDASITHMETEPTSGLTHQWDTRGQGPHGHIAGPLLSQHSILVSCQHLTYSIWQPCYSQGTLPY